MGNRTRQLRRRGGAAGGVASALLAGLLLWAVAGCAAPVINAQVKPSESLASAATVKVGPRPVFPVGERLEAGVWLHGVPVGKVVTRVEQVCGAAGDQAVEVRSDAKAAGPLSEINGGKAELRTLVDLTSGLPLSARWWQQVTRPVEYELHFAADHFWAMSKRPTASSRPRPSAVPSPVHDVHSALGLMRGWNAAVGEQQHFYVVMRRTLWRVEVVRRGPCEVETAGRETRAIRIDGVAQRVRPSMELDDKKPRDFALWLSDDEDRTPLRMVVATDWGELDARLLSRKLGAPREPASSVSVAVESAKGAGAVTPPAVAGVASSSPAELPDGCSAELGPSEPMRQAMAQAEREKQRQKERLIRQARQAKSAARRAVAARGGSRGADRLGVVSGRVPRGWASRRRGVYLRRNGRGGRAAPDSDELVGGLSPEIDISQAPLDSCGLVPSAR